MSEDNTYGNVDVSIQTNTKEPENVHEFGCRDDYPEEVAELWDEIRAGLIVPVDNDGYRVDRLEDAEVVMHPSYGMAGLPSSLSGIGPGELPPVTSTRVGRPDEVGDPDILEDEFQFHQYLWIDPETGNFMVADSEKIIDWNEGEIVEVFDHE